MGVQNSPEAGLDEKAVIAAAERALSDIAIIRKEVGKVIFGQESVVEQTMLAVLSGGHALLVGVPGLAKTKLVVTLGTVLGLSSSRIQFTPDLMPSDILGSEVMDQDENGKRSFRFVPGPIFTQLLMADEINRASPRTQSALLQAMQEYHVTVAGQTNDLPKPFHVLATQNPLEQEGTYPLPKPSSTGSSSRSTSTIPSLPPSARSSWKPPAFPRRRRAPPSRPRASSKSRASSARCRSARRCSTPSSPSCAPPVPATASPPPTSMSPGAPARAPARR